MSKKFSRKQIACLLGVGLSIFVFLLILAVPSPKQNSRSEVQPYGQGEQKSPEQIFEEIGQKTSKYSRVLASKEGDEWVVVNLIQSDELFSGIGDLFTGKDLSRSFIFGVYATGLPVKHASVSINNISAGKFYRAGLSGEVAKTQPKSTWTNREVGPTIFYNFLKQHTNGSAGDGKNSTYIETNLN